MQDRITLGDTLSFATTVPDYLASAGWTLRYRLIQRTTGTPITLTAIVDPDNADGYVVQVAAATTAGWSAGEYSWASWVAQGAEVYSLGQGTCTLIPDPRTAAAGVDLRSPAEIALGDAKAAYYAYTPTRRSYKIGDREMVFNSAEDLIKHVQFLQAEVTAERRLSDMAKGYPDKRKVFVRMSGA